MFSLARVPWSQPISAPILAYSRQHIEDSIRKHQCDLTCATIARGSPHVLSCTKTTASYERKLKEYHEDLQHLEGLRSLVANVNAGVKGLPLRLGKTRKARPTI